MKLAKEFMFVLGEARAGTVFRAKECEDGDYQVSWLSDGYSDFHTEWHAREDARRNIISGEWIVREIVQRGEDDVERFTARHTSGSEFDVEIYSGVAHCTTDLGKVDYPEPSARKFLAEGTWKKVEPVDEASLEPCDDIVDPVVWPLPVTTVAANIDPGTVEPDFLPPDDIGDLIPDYGITLSDLRRSLKELESGGWVLEICEDFFTLRQEDDVYNDRFVAKDEAELAAILQAVRTLDKFCDKG